MKKKIVCFCDIIAFKELVEKVNNNLVPEQTIIDIFKTIKWELNINNIRSDFYLKEYGIENRDNNRKTFQFSDSVTITASLDESASLFELLLELFYIQLELIKYNIFLRGAITIDNVNDDEFIFGIGLNEAYRLESKKAIYPRIIIEESTINEYLDTGNLYNNRDLEEGYLKDFLIKDDGYYYINYFAPDPNLFDDYETGFINFVNKLKLAIESLENENNTEKDLIKIDWLKKQFSNYTLPLLEEVKLLIN